MCAIILHQLPVPSPNPPQTRKERGKRSSQNTAHIQSGGFDWHWDIVTEFKILSSDYDVTCGCVAGNIWAYDKNAVGRRINTHGRISPVSVPSYIVWSCDVPPDETDRPHSSCTKYTHIPVSMYLRRSPDIPMSRKKRSELQAAIGENPGRWRANSKCIKAGTRKWAITLQTVTVNVGR